MRTPFVIPISGKAMSGKDTLAIELKKMFEYAGCSVAIIHYGDFLKMIASQCYGWGGIKDDAGRNLLQRLGTEVVRYEHPNFWVDIVMDFITAFNKEFDVFLIPDARFINEIEIPKEVFECCVSIRIIRPSFYNRILTPEQKEHLSETALDEYDGFDYVVAIDENRVVDAAMTLFPKLLRTFWTCLKEKRNEF